MKNFTKKATILVMVIVAIGLALFLFAIIAMWDELEQERLGYPDDPTLKALRSEKIK